MPGLLVTGTSSDAGKSLLVTGLCRAWARTGIRVAPFKAQNMSNNSMVCTNGDEIGRAQYLQAQAARVEASALMNPVLIKPASDRRAFLVVDGRPDGRLAAGEYATGRTRLAEAAFDAYERLAASYDLVVCEGAGSPAEINLRAGDYVNLGLARRFALPSVVVADIDRGGALAALYGTWALLEPGDRELLRGYVINKFRGDHDVLAPGLAAVTRRTGLPWLGTLPWLSDVWLDAEDAASLGGWESRSGASLNIAVVSFPRTSNATDIDALAAEPGVSVLVSSDPAACRGADLLVLPGTRSTVADLAWLRERGLDSVVLERVAAGRPVLGICGGYQMLGTIIADDHESGAGDVPGLGVLAARTAFGAEKVLARPTGSWAGETVTGYEIHHGVVTAEPNFPGGTRSGATYGTIWHATLENDGFRRAWLAEVATAAGSSWRADASAPPFAARRETMIDRLADAVNDHLDLDALLALADHSPGSGTGPSSLRQAPSVPPLGPVESHQRTPPGLDHHGDAEASPGLVNLAVNVRIERPPDWLARVIVDATGTLGAYPDPAQARAALAARHGVGVAAVLPTSGAAEAFTLVARAYRGRRALIVHPQFTEPEAALRRAGNTPERLRLHPGKGFELRATDVPDAAELVVIGNPTNPTGVLHRRTTILALRRPGRIVVVDEAFMDAVPGEPESLIGADLDGLLVLRSLTKTWGLAGLRAGYVLGDTRLIAELAAQQSPWSVSTPALAVMVATAQAAARDEAVAAAATLAANRAHLFAGLRDLGLNPVAGAAPFVLVQVGDGVKDALRGRGFAVRRGDTFPGLGPEWIRIAARHPSISDALLAALRDVGGRR